MKVAITGGSGFVGKALTTLLQYKGHDVYILSRSNHDSNNRNIIQWLSENNKPENYLNGVDAWVNLAGVSINEGRWTEEQKQKIYDSRMKSTNEMLRIIDAVEEKPSVIINASAIGIYPASETTTYTENSTERGTDFLAKTVEDWEKKATQAEKFGTRIAYGRFGIILGENEGALPLIALPYKMFVGGKVGTGRQWLSWVHIEDVARAILFAIEKKDLFGPFNVTSPNPYNMDDFGKILGDVLKRPHWIPVPSIALKLALGDKSQLVLQGQRVYPEKLINHGFSFKFPELKKALQEIYE
ncbi:MAG: TIGR01777 family oxidoreductase [Paenisporosarcina sp.]